MICAKFGWNLLSGSWEEDFLMSLVYLVIISLWERAGPFIWKQTWIPFNQWHIVRSFVEIGPVVLVKKMKMWKVYDNNENDDNDNDSEQILIRKASNQKTG